MLEYVILKNQLVVMNKNYPHYLFLPYFLLAAHHRLVSVEDVITFIEYQVLIGNRKWIKEKNFIDIPHEIDEKMKKQEELGHTALLVAIDGKNERKKLLLKILTRNFFKEFFVGSYCILFAEKTLLGKMCSSLFRNIEVYP